MKITICGSIAFFEQMQNIAERLVNMGNEVELPPTEIMDQNGMMIPVTEYYNLRKEETSNESWVWQRKSEAIKTHFDKIVWAEAIIVLNFDKNGVTNYIGGNTFLEMGIAFFLNKPIYLWHPVPEIAYKEEILGMFPIVINEDLRKI